MTYIHWAFVAIYVLVTAATMVAVLLDNRQPAKTLAWMLVLAFMPLVGIVLYFFFGQNIRKERHISQASLDQLTKRTMLEFVEQRNLQLPERHRKLIDLYVNQGWALPFKNNETDIYTDGYAFIQALLSAIGSARHHIHLDTYLIEDDALGRLIADALIDKVREGVEVRLIYDDVGCWRVPNRFFDRMKAAGVQVRSFMPVRFPAFTSKVNYRNHRKICVVDGRVGFIGGMNIALRYVKGQGGQAWRDTHLRIRGHAVYALQRAFLVDWFFTSRKLLTDRIYYPAMDVKPNDSLIQIVTSNPTNPWPDLEQGYVQAILSARRYIYIETPYFLPTEPVLFALKTAAVSGVEVRLMVPNKGDAKLVEWASVSYVKDTMDAGVKVYFYTSAFNHSKLLIIDDTLASCGSANVDFRSFENNFEANAFFYDEVMALRLKQVFLNDEAHCICLDDTHRITHRPFYVRLWESLVRLLAPLL